MTIDFKGPEFQTISAYIESIGSRFQVVFVETDSDGDVIDQPADGEGEFDTMTASLDFVLDYADTHGLERV